MNYCNSHTFLIYWWNCKNVYGLSYFNQNNYHYTENNRRKLFISSFNAHSVKNRIIVSIGYTYTQARIRSQCQLISCQYSFCFDDTKNPKLYECTFPPTFPAKQSIMAKRKLEDDNELSGFVHDLTPLKVSRTNAKYFNCILQTDTSEYKRVVCFDSVKRSLFENAEQTKSPVKLKDVKEVPSKDNNSPDIMVNSKSDLQSIKATKLDFNHHPRSRQEVKTAEICIKDVQTLPEKTMVRMKEYVRKTSIRILHTCQNNHYNKHQNC